MTVQVQEIFNESVGNGVTTVFPYGFTLLTAADLVVQLDGVDVAPSAFTVSGIGMPNGGNITFTTPPASGAIVLRKRVLPLQRLTDYQDNGDLLAETLNRDIDRIWMTLQQFARDLLRSLKLPFTTQANQEIENSPAARANKAVVFDADGNITLSSHTIQQIEAPSQAADDAVAAASAAASSASAASTSAGLANTAKLAAETAQAAAEAAQAAAEIAAPPTATVAYFARTTAPAGWVRLHGGTIGSATSGASERAHADTHDLFVLLWNQFDDIAAPVIGGRGASAEADWLADKRITLFDDRGLFDRAFDDTATVNPAGTAIGGQQADALQGFKVQVPAATPAVYSGGGAGGTYMNLTENKSPISDGINGTPRIASETRPKSRTYLKCIKL